MRKRQEKGLIISVIVILLCLFLILILGGPAVLQDLSKKEMTGSLSEFADYDIYQNDSETGILQEASEEPKEDSNDWMEVLSFKRSSNQLLLIVIAGVLILYLLVIGPAAYYYLKRIGKMEWIWLLLPVVSVIFGCLILMLGNEFTIRMPQADVLAVMRPGEKTVCYGSVISPTDSVYRLTFSEETGQLHHWTSTGRYEYSEEQRLLLIQPEYAFEKDYFQYVLNQHGQGTIECNLIKTEDGMSGTLRNCTESDFSCVMVCLEDDYCILPALASGEQCEVVAKTWMNDEYGEEGSLKEEFRMQPGMGQDEKRILNYAWHLHTLKQEEGIHIAAIGTAEECGLESKGVELISYNLFFQ